jgi:hypothetical protein
MEAQVVVAAREEIQTTSRKVPTHQVAAEEALVHRMAETEAMVLVERLTDNKVELQMDLVEAVVVAVEPLDIG